MSPVLERRHIEQKKSPDIVILQRRPDAVLENLDRFVYRVPRTVEYPEFQG
ncbi:MAG: hypothetical protein LBE10_08355 [Treponema sp.]|jgi:hypothetical protein|nr:hypothetical protein [Treponema sp.]